jgi:hypothetical protein
MTHYCTKCGNVGVPDVVTEREFSVGLFVVLLVLGIIPGLIYLALGGSAQLYYECTKCSGRLCLIPVDSPIAQAALSKARQLRELRSAGKSESREHPTRKQASNSSMLMEGLKEELFQLEVEHKEGRIAQQEYEKVKAALDHTLQRHLERERQKA